MRFLIITLTFLALTGCQWLSHPIDNLFETYIGRIANVQDTDALEITQNQNIILPDKRALLIEIPSLTIGLLDSYELRKCDLFNLIAERNSVLGKVQDQFRNYDYQVDVIRGIESCLNSDVISPDIKQELHTLLALKQNQLAAHFSNLLFASDAMRSQLSASEWLDQQHTSANKMLTTGLDNLAAHYLMLNGEQQQAKSLVPFQESFEKQVTIGKIVYSMLNASHKLDQITAQLEQYDEKIVCGPGRNDTRFKTLRNVFQSFFVEQIQPYLARVDSAYLQISQSGTLLENAHPSYHYPLLRYHQVYRKSISQHVQYWQALFKRCGASPTR